MNNAYEYINKMDKSNKALTGLFLSLLTILLASRCVVNRQVLGLFLLIVML